MKLIELTAPNDLLKSEGFSTYESNITFDNDSIVGYYGTKKDSMAYVILADDEYENPAVISEYSDVLQKTATHTKIYTNCGIGVHSTLFKKFCKSRNIEIIKIHRKP